MRAPLTLLYHAIAEQPPGCDDEELHMIVTPREFERQMAALSHRGYRSLRLAEFAGRLRDQNDEGTFLLTFDDAYAHVDDVVTPILRRHGFSAVMFVPWAHVGRRNSWDPMHARLAALEIAGPNQLQRMVGVWELAGHGLHHVDLRSLPTRSRQRDLAAAREGLSELAGRPVTEIAYPFGSHDAGVRRDAAAAGYEMGFTTSGAPTDDPLQLPRRPIHGDDGRLAFRAKTEPAAAWLYRLRTSAAGLAGAR
jgi:peptidoglycan/xylan/chitin deacetylase (PgdA/CDA1 family)